MNGLDLTSWIEKASTVGMIQTVCAVAALISGGLCFFVFVTSFGSEPSKPVSYTHLDVYKRQRPRSATRKSTTPPNSTSAILSSGQATPWS